jgi:hypothetical protein
VDLVRQLCGEIAAEQDPEKVEDLLSLLHAVVKENQEEVRLRMGIRRQKIEPHSSAVAVGMVEQQLEERPV